MFYHFNTNLHLCIVVLLMFVIGAVAWRTHFLQKILQDEPLFKAKLKLSVYLLYLLLLLCAAWLYSIINVQNTEKRAFINKYKQKASQIDTAQIWQAPDIAEIPDEYPNKKQIIYGRDLIANTNDYFGKNGCVKPSAINGMNCQNCHLSAGTKPFGNNYAAVLSTYPKFRARSGTQETIIKRINDCFQRSLNGEALDSTSREMKAIVAYIEWLGTGIPKGFSPKGVGLTKLKFLDRAADPTKGQLVYQAKCASCHADDGQGLAMPIPKESLLESNNGRRYPPLWGENSYNEAAGLFRLSNLAGYVKSNMPFGTSYQNPQLTDEEAWDVAAFINAQPHPKHKFLDKDFPNIAKKPFDHPFGPFKDTFSETQHKFGPFQEVVDFYKK